MRLHGRLTRISPVTVFSSLARRASRPFSTSVIASLATVFFAALAAGAQNPWNLTIRPATTPIPAGTCTPIRLDLRDAGGKEPRNPAGVRVSIADFDWSVVPAGKVVGRYDGASAWSACACLGAEGSVATITATYPAQTLNQSARVPGVAFQSSLTVPLAAPNGTFNPPACLGTSVVATAQTARAAQAAPATATTPTAPSAPAAPATPATPSAPSAPAPTGPAIRSGPVMKTGVPTLAPNPDLSRTIPLSGYQASGSFVAVAPRTFPLAGFSASGSFVAVAPRSFALNGFTASGTFVAVASRTIALAGWTGVGPQKTP